VTAARTIQLSPRQKLHKRAARALIEAVGGVEAAAGFCRIGKSQLSDCCNPNILAFLPSDVIEDLEALAPDPVMTRMLAGAQAHDCVRRPDGLLSDADFCPALAAAVKEFDEAQRKIIEALPGGVTAAEIRDGNILGELEDVQRSAAQLTALCRSVTGEDR
jgi:hypothetical protein